MVDKTAAAMGNIPESLLGKAVNAEGASEVGEGFSKLMKGGASKAGGEADKIAGKLSGELSGELSGAEKGMTRLQGAGKVVGAAMGTIFRGGKSKDGYALGAAG